MAYGGANRPCECWWTTQAALKTDIVIASRKLLKNNMQRQESRPAKYGRIMSATCHESLRQIMYVHCIFPAKVQS